jgi:hypothetical protein
MYGNSGADRELPDPFILCTIRHEAMVGFSSSGLHQKVKKQE